MNALTHSQFEQEALPHMPALYGMALKYTHNESEAEDLVQDSMIKAYNNFDSYVEGTNCRAWLFRIMTNTFINKYRRKRRERAYLDSVVQENTNSDILIANAPEQDLEESESDGTSGCFYAFSDEIVRAFNSVSSEFKSIVMMADLQDLSYKEIAEKLDIPIGTVMSRLFRGRQMLKKNLTEYAIASGYHVK